METESCFKSPKKNAVHLKSITEIDNFDENVVCRTDSITEMFTVYMFVINIVGIKFFFF